MKIMNILEYNSDEKWLQIQTHPFYKPFRERLEEYARLLMNIPINALSYSKFKLFMETGSRDEYEEELHGIINRITAFSLLLKLTDDQKYVSRLEDALWAICDLYTWCYPAHLKYDDYSVPGGFVRLEFEKESTWIDLNVAEIAFGLCEVLMIVGDKISKQVCKRVETEIDRRVIHAFLQREKPFQWETQKANWAAVCGGSLLMVFLYCSTPQQIDLALPQLKECLDCYLEGIGEDGCCREGCNYWSYGFGYFVAAAAGLRQYSKGKVDYFKYSKVKKLAEYPQKIILSKGKCANFADSQEIFHRNIGIAHYLIKEYDTVYIPCGTYYADFFWGNHSRICFAIRDLLWSDPKVREQQLKKEMCFFEDAAVYINHKELYDFAAKAGNNAEPHNHNDVGQFILSVDGYTVLSDLSGEKYSKDYFDPEKRYTLICPSSLGHNLPLINGMKECAGKEYFGRVIEATERIFKVEIAGAYPKECKIESFVREFILSDNKFILKNRYVFKRR